MPSLATSPRRVRQAIKRFENEVRGSSGLAGRLSYARAWYACRDAKGRWQFGPSKFVGYERLTAPGVHRTVPKGPRRAAHRSSASPVVQGTRPLERTP